MMKFGLPLTVEGSMRGECSYGERKYGTILLLYTKWYWSLFNHFSLMSFISR